MELQGINELINVLEQEAKVYEDILKISKNKTNIIVEGKVSNLETIVKLEQALVMQMGRLEDMRENLVDKIAKQLGVDPSKLTISDILKHVKGAEGLKLKNSQDNITYMLRELKDANEVNNKLIKNSLEYIDFSINVLTNIDTGVNNYGSTGRTGDGKKKTFFDVKL